MFHTLHTEQFLANLLNRYNSICSLIPMDQRASIQVNMQFLCHSNLVPIPEKPCAFDTDKTKYSQALKMM